jgi:hypothetical protein
MKPSGASCRALFLYRRCAPLWEEFGGLFYQRFMFRAFFCELPVREQPSAALQTTHKGFLRCAANAVEVR